MVTFDQLVALALDGNNRTGETEINRATVELVVRSTIDGLGFHISDKTGEVCDPRPRKVINYPYDQRNARWNGSGQRGGGRR